MKDYLISPAVQEATLEPSFQKISNITAAADAAYGDPDNSNGWIASLPVTFLEVSDPEALAAATEQRLQEELQEASSGTGLTDEQRKSALPLNEQAILLYRMGELLQYNRDKKRKENEYDRFAILECEGAEEIESLVNYLTAPEDVSAIFDKVRPIHLSAVIPRVRLWKKYYWEDKRVNQTGASSTDPVYIEYEFEEHADPGLLGQTLTTNTGVGLESFNWEFNGDNMFSAEKLIQAEIKMRAQSVDALEKLRKSSNSSNPEKNTYAFSDIFIPDKRRKDNSGNRENTGNYQEYEMKNMKVRAEVEYAVDKNSHVFSGPANKEVAEALESLKLAINLSVTSYSLDLKDDGSVGVSVNFQGSIDATTQDPAVGNILPNKKFTEEQRADLIRERSLVAEDIAIAKQQLIDLEVERKTQLNLPNRQNILTDDQKAAEKESYIKNVKLIREDIQKWESQYSLTGAPKSDSAYLAAVTSKEFKKLSLYRTILNGLLQRGAVNILAVDPNNIAKTHEEIKAGANRGQFVDNKDLSTREKNWTAERPSEEQMSKADMDDSFKILAERMKQDIVPMFLGDEYFIRFFYFGDLMDIVLDNMYSNPDTKTGDLDIRTVLGPIEIKRNVFSSDKFSKPIKFLQTGDLVVASKYGTYDPQATRDLKGAVKQANESIEQGASPTTSAPSTQPLLASLADVPISLNLFLRWFSENVSKKNAFGYSFKNFLVDAAQSLIVASLEADSSRVLLPKQQRKIKTVIWDGATSSKPDPFGFVLTDDDGLKVSLSKEERIKRSKTGSELEKVRKDIKSSHQLRGGAHMSDYLLVYAASSEPVRRYSGSAKDYARDAHDGIYHLTLGRDVGVVKDISLSAPTTTGYEEMQLQRAMQTGAITTKRVYDATVTMFGVTFFRPGQMIYIEPAAFGTRENLKAHGLCGYYSVVTTSNNFTAGTFETVLTCAFQSEG